MAALAHEIAFAHCAELAHQRQRVVVLDVDGLAVRHRQGKARALQQAGRVAQIGERRDTRAEAAFDLALGRAQRLAQLPQRGAAQHRAEEEAVWLQDAADLDQRAGQVVHPMQVHRAQHEIEAGGGERQRFFVGDQRRTVGIAGKAEAEIGAHECSDRLGAPQHFGDLIAMAAEVERQRKGPAHVGQSLDEAARDLALEEGLAIPAARGPFAAQTQHVAVEDQQGIGRRHGLYVGRKRGGG